MTEMHGPREAGDGPSGSVLRQEIDWAAAAQLPEFEELTRRRRNFVVPATVFFMAWFFGFILLCGYAPDFMGEKFIADGITVGFALALTQFVMVWVLVWLYLRKAEREFDPLAERAVEEALELNRSAEPAAEARRFERAPAASGQGEEVTRR